MWQKILKTAQSILIQNRSKMTDVLFIAAFTYSIYLILVLKPSVDKGFRLLGGAYNLSGLYLLKLFNFESQTI